MRALTYVFAAVALAALASANAQSTSGAQTPARQSTTSAPAATPAQPNATTQPTTPSNAQQTVRPPDSRRTTDDTATNNSVKNRANPRQRVPPASRGVGPTNNRPDCSKLRGLEKSECERRDTSRDDLPAGVTTTQPEK
jgi:hypothetical protein